MTWAILCSNCEKYTNMSETTIWFLKGQKEKICTVHIRLQISKWLQHFILFVGHLLFRLGALFLTPQMKFDSISMDTHIRILLVFKFVHFSVVLCLLSVFSNICEFSWRIGFGWRWAATVWARLDLFFISRRRRKVRKPWQQQGGEKDTSRAAHNKQTQTGERGIDESQQFDDHQLLVLSGDRRDTSLPLIKASSFLFFNSFPFFFLFRVEKKNSSLSSCCCCWNCYLFVVVYLFIFAFLFSLSFLLENTHDLKKAQPTQPL